MQAANYCKQCTAIWLQHCKRVSKCNTYVFLRTYSTAALQLLKAASAVLVSYCR